ncbi:hypothetical protein [Siphonobacter sp. SORGH_AS_1065]|uniref:hypothetical protein n=1 Tax=Siphonobacter sp. SORGH_AS_1065 TaxID=3041795 RepID=UPI00277F5815|nr:hypothetical protein [Siphonobacter sp. SORGH_AS_1065]MDQ1087271.1 hypothetical protein [Siphonobacter sp. SORGH_AS_1065]
MKKKKVIIWSIILILFVGICNIPIISLFISVYTGNIYFKRASFHFISEKGGFSVWARNGYEDIVSQFEAYKKRHPEDTVLYRNFQIKPWQFWRIYEYSDPPYRLPYREMPPDVSRVDIVK